MAGNDDSRTQEYPNAESDAQIRHAVREIREQGYCVLESFLSGEQVDQIGQFLDAKKDHYFGRNNFEGDKTERIYAILSQGKLFQDLVEDPRIMALCDRFLEPNYLLTTSQAICIHPGETPQPWHCDDAFYGIARPRTVALSTVIAIDDFTAKNGCTEVIPGSHLWSDEEIAGDYRSGDRETDADFVQRMAGKSVAVEMPAGACVVFSSNTLHRGGRNSSQTVRRALSNQYCQPWLRTIENFYLTIPRAQVREMSPRVQSLLGYSVHPPFMGQVSGSHPLKTLNPGFVPSVFRRE